MMSAYEGYKVRAIECECEAELNRFINEIADDERINARQYEVLRHLAIKATYENNL